MLNVESLPMAVSEQERKRLLAAVRKATADVEKVRQRRRDAVQAAMDAGIKRGEIAEAAGVSRERVYQIIKGQ